MGVCHVCHDDSIPDVDLLDHVRVMHPDAWGEGPEKWPDGEFVIHDDTLEPSEFHTPDDNESASDSDDAGPPLGV